MSASAQKIATPNEVNVINFTSLPSALFNTTASTRDGVCKKPEQPATAGWFRLLFDINEDEVTDKVTASIGTGPFGITDTVSVPKVLGVVGFVTMTAPTSIARISATFPYQSEEPYDFYDCYNDLSLNCETHDSSVP